jgi:hypothetical protein
MLAQTISAPAISFFIFTPIPLTLCGITAAPIAEDQARKCELAHTSPRLSKKQRLTELCCKTDARGGGGRRPPERAIRTRRGLIIVGRHKDRAIAMNIAASLVAGLVLALVLGIWLYAITIWLFVH